MANGEADDPWNPQTYAPSQPEQDPNYLNAPPGTVSSVNIQENDPLRAWARQMTPDQFAQFQAKHAQGDPEGAKQSLIDAGVPPPDHHYDQNGQPFYPVDAMGDTRMTSTGNIQTTPAQQIQQAVQQAQGGPPRAPGLAPTPRAATEPDVPPQPSNVPPGTAGFGQGAAEAIKKAGRAIGNVFTSPANPSYGQNPMSPQPQPPAKPGPYADKEVNPSEGQPLVPRPRPAGAGPRPTKTTYETDDGGRVTIEHGTGEGEGAKVPTPRSDPRKEKKSLTMQDVGEAGSFLAKSLEGVKAPPRPPFPQVGAVAPRSPISVGHPQLNNLLTMIGQNPAAAQGLIQRLGLRG